jgi:hypothetical protein
MRSDRNPAIKLYSTAARGDYNKLIQLVLSRPSVPKSFTVEAKEPSVVNIAGPPTVGIRWQSARQIIPNRANVVNV